MKRYQTGLVVLFFFTWGSVFLARMSVLYLAPFVAPASLRSFRLQVIRRWTRALRRRSQKSRMTWPRLVAIAERWLAKPNILHLYPNLRFDARHPR
jgi:RNA-directed DNA polymerase